jgi:hypothetical protein
LTNGDKRREERKIVSTKIRFSSIYGPVNRDNTFDARVIDICEGGMGIVTAWPIAPGQIIRFTGVSNQSTGIVKWSMVINRRDEYRMGVQFISAEDVSRLTKPV